jgi:hypothetical protein
LPRLAAKLSSEFIVGKSYPTAAQECGLKIIYEMTGDAQLRSTLSETTTAGHTLITIHSIDPLHSGLT